MVRVYEDGFTSYDEAAGWMKSYLTRWLPIAYGTALQINRRITSNGTEFVVSGHRFSTCD